MQAPSTLYQDGSSVDEQPETPFASGDRIPAGYGTTAGTAGIQTTPFTGARSIPIEGLDSDRAYTGPDICSTTDSEVLRQLCAMDCKTTAVGSLSPS